MKVDAKAHSLNFISAGHEDPQVRVHTVCTTDTVSYDKRQLLSAQNDVMPSFQKRNLFSKADN